MTIEVRVPALGESVTEATVGTWLKQPGEAVADGEVLCELETDKVNLEVVAPAAGVMQKHAAAAGDVVGPDAVLAVIDADGTAAAAPEPAAAAPAESAPAAPAATPTPSPKPVAEDVAASPSARKIMAEQGIDPATVAGSGRGGRVMKEDVMSGAPALKPATPAPQPATGTPAGPEDETRVPMTRLRQTIARRLKQAQDTAAILTTFNEVDMSAAMALRAEHKEDFEKAHGVRLGFMGFFVKACVQALKELPAVNAQIDDTDIVYQNRYHIGVAVGTPTGLVVPVVRDADQLSFAGIEQTVGALGKRAREGTLEMSDLTGGTFTISNGGVYGSLMSTPILNPPQSGILGMHKIQERPVVVDGEMVVRPMMYLALSYDHRIVDGREAVTFLVRVKEGVEDPARLLLDM